MAKIGSLDDLKKMREQLRAELEVRELGDNPDAFPQVKVSMGTCGINAGAKEIMSEFINILKDRNIDAVVTQTDCMGRCGSEPTVEVTLPGQEPVVFGDVDSARVSRIIDDYILNGGPAEGLISREGR